MKNANNEKGVTENFLSVLFVNAILNTFSLKFAFRGEFEATKSVPKNLSENITEGIPIRPKLRSL